MPELPDVEVARRRLARSALRRRVASCAFGDERLLEGTSKQKIARGLSGRELRETARRGKQLGLKTEAGEWLTLHFGMTGDAFAIDEGDDVPEYAQLTARFEDGGALVFVNKRKLGSISWAGSFDAYCEEHDLGPDALGISKCEFCRVIEGRSGQIKPLLMNQSALAGVGNVYADETLFQASVRPDRSAGDASEEEAGELWRVMRRVLRTAIRHGAEPRDMPRGWLLPVRSDDGAACPRCGGTLERRTVSGRTAVFCADHQR